MDVSLSTGAEDALEIPDSLRRLRIDLIEEATSVVFGEDTGEAPRLVLQWLNVLDLYEENVARFSTFDLEWPG
jgi:hypothetical protein